MVVLYLIQHMIQVATIPRGFNGSLRQPLRWYPIRVDYAGSPPDNNARGMSGHFDG